MKMLDKQLIQEISKLGLTTKQAKTYISIVTKKSTTIPQIAKRTGLHEQDIYSIVKALQKKGLVTRTAFRPIRVESIPVEEALNNLLNLKQEHIDKLRKSTKEIIKAIKTKQEPKNECEEQKFQLIPAPSEALKNKIELVFERINETYDCYIPKDIFLKVGVPIFLEKFQRFASRKVKARILISSSENDNGLIETIRKTQWPRCNVTMKVLKEKNLSYYAIIDNKEVWIPTDIKNEGPVLVTDSKAVVNMAKESFERCWQAQSSDIIFQEKKE